MKNNITIINVNKHVQYCKEILAVPLKYQEGQCVYAL